MTHRTPASRLPMLAFVVAVALDPASRASADAPKVSSFFPGGAARGETVTVKAEGSFEPWPVLVSVDRPGVDFVPGEEAGTFEVTVSPDATPGPRWIRLHNDEGAASLRPFAVGTLPEVVEVEPNDANDQAQAIEAEPVVVNGRLQRSNDVDAFAVPLDPGQTLVASLQANRALGSPMDGVLQVATPDGFVLDHADDSPGLDPTIAFTAPSSGTYLVRVFAFPADPNSSIRFDGGDDHVYRLILTTGGLVEFAQPSAVPPGDEAPALSPIGWNLPDDPGPLLLGTVSPPGDGQTALAHHAMLPGSADVAVVPLPVATEPGLDAEPIPAPSILCGAIGEPGEVDDLPILAPADMPIRIRVPARSFGSPLDPVLRVLDSSGEELERSDDAGRSDRDPEVTVKAPADGLLRLQIRDLHGRGGPRFLYRVVAEEPAPDVSLSKGADHVELRPGTPLEVEVSVDRRGDFDRPITFEAEGLPPGVTLEPVVSEPKGDSSKKVKLRLSGPEAAPWSGPIRLLGRAEGDEAARPVQADRVGGPPTSELWLTVLPAE
ncbi:PPC domain-containing protein [Tautonia plasticadhaerens]|uniref:Peptidase C-terminal archaeal/bacterial domain-containing protein n=1 Tax=Tautonia plasticadhaerens TaxID=2527974 RepID=A0A518H9M0_9BACT|nr:PPC domain-containing protein [Tautonia plasticadhaerens]QDV37497.1 hypothetical protein ElP_54370 [Tautonia plasticadhaerens]